MQRAFLLALSAAALLLLCLSSATATWVPYFGVPLCGATDYQMGPVIVPDGAGGAIVAWTDYRSGSSPDIYAQRIDFWGDTLWTPDGVLASADPNGQALPAAVTDGAGGAIIVWEDDRNGARDIFGQRVDSSGSVVWIASGAAVCTAALTQKDPATVSDGAGGAIVAWVDYRSGVSTDIYAQRIGPGGLTVWAAGGVPLCAAEGSQTNIVIAEDGAGGAIAAWEDRRAGQTTPRIYAQRIDAAGAVIWASDGISACPASPYSVNPSIVSDGMEGAILVWENVWSGTVPVLVAQRITAAGSPAWGDCGIAVCSDNGGQRFPILAPDGEGGAVIVWTDLRAGESTPDIYAQRLTRDAEHLWQPTGAAVSAAAGEQSHPSLAATEGGFVIAWQDFRSPSDLDIYAQKLDGDGSAQWTGDGMLVCFVIDFQDNPVLVSDGSGGALVAWQDHRNRFDYDIYAQRVNMNGDVTGAEGPEAPSGTFLAQNVPNPFNPATRIAFGLERPARVSLRIYDVSGRLVRTLVDAQLGEGRHEAFWDGKDASGAAAASGIYFCRLEAGPIIRTGKMTLLR